MKIDLHCHTKKVKKGDSPTRNVTPELFRQKVESADVKIVAITNHNCFDLNQYVTLCEAVSGICQVWPGVEIDVQGEGKYHLIIVTRPEDSREFSKVVAALFNGKDVNTCLLTIEEICEAFEQFEVIYIPHYHDKKPAISLYDREKLEKLIDDSSRIFIEPRNHRTLGVLANKDLNVLIGSDVQDWNHYEECTFAELRLPVGSFSEFLLLARRDANVVETLLNKKVPIKITGRPHKSVKLPLKIYPDINILFGQKGTGKTEILKSLYDEMVKSGKNCQKYIASENTDDFDDFTKIQDMELDLSKIGAEPCAEEFELISEWADANPVQFSMYLQWAETKGNSNNKSRMKITEAVHDVFIKDDTYLIHKTDKTIAENLENSLKSMNLEEYLTTTDSEALMKLISQLSEAVISKRESDVIAEYASRLTNFSIDKIKSIADLKSDTVSRP